MSTNTTSSESLGDDFLFRLRTAALVYLIVVIAGAALTTTGVSERTVLPCSIVAIFFFIAITIYREDLYKAVHGKILGLALFSWTLFGGVLLGLALLTRVFHRRKGFVLAFLGGAFFGGVLLGGAGFGLTLLGLTLRGLTLLGLILLGGTGFGGAFLGGAFLGWAFLGWAFLGGVLLGGVLLGGTGLGGTLLCWALLGLILLSGAFLKEERQ